MDRLAGRVAVITGGAKGIGRAAACLFASEGARVAVLDLDEESGAAVVARIRREGGEAIFLACDVSCLVPVERAVGEALEQFGQIDILYNNAGIGYAAKIPVGTVADIPECNWHRVLDVNLKSVYLLSKFVVPIMKDAGRGSIIHTASVMALSGLPGAEVYTASKGAIVSLTRAMARDLGPHGIRVNTLCPGPVDTPMLAPVTSDPEWMREEEERIPLGRIAQPEEIAFAALYLASDESSFVTGSVLLVDGGMTA